jgi:hypothetical protein
MDGAALVERPDLAVEGLMDDPVREARDDDGPQLRVADDPDLEGRGAPCLGQEAPPLAGEVPVHVELEGERRRRAALASAGSLPSVVQGLEGGHPVEGVGREARVPTPAHPNPAATTKR